MRARGVAAAVAGLVLLVGCERLEGVVSGGESTAGPRVARVVVFVPDGGRSGAAGEAVTRTVRLALDDVAADGWTVRVDSVTDGGSDGTAAAARRVADDSDVIGVVGGLSTPVVRAAQPVLDEAGIPFISPADTVAEHTRGADPTMPRRPYESYFRAAVPETDSQEVAAEYAVLGLGASTVSVVDGDEPPEAASFTHHARRLGAEVVDEGGDHSTAASVRYVAAGPRVAAEAAATDPEAVVIGGAGVVSDAFLTMAGTAAEGTVGVVPATLQPSAGRAVPGVGDPGRFGAAAYDAGTALAATLERCLPSVRAGAARDARTGCMAELGRTGFEGRTGEFSFDRYGDRRGAFPQVFVVTDGAWTEVGRQ